MRDVKLMKRLALPCEFLDLTVIRQSEIDAPPSVNLVLVRTMMIACSYMPESWIYLQLPLWLMWEGDHCGLPPVSVFTEECTSRGISASCLAVYTCYAMPCKHVLHCPFIKRPGWQVELSLHHECSWDVCGGVNLRLNRSKPCTQLVVPIHWLQPAVTFTGSWAVPLQLLCWKWEQLKDCWNFFSKEALSSQSVA